MGEQRAVTHRVNCTAHVTVHLPGAGGTAGDVIDTVEVCLQLVAGAISGLSVTISKVTGVFAS